MHGRACSPSRLAVRRRGGLLSLISEERAGLVDRIAGLGRPMDETELGDSLAGVRSHLGLPRDAADARRSAHLAALCQSGY